MKEDSLVVHEVFASIQGESSFAGLPCTFVRLTGCNLRCVWCDTTQAFRGGTRLGRAEVLERALAFGTNLIELTGGEPLLQPGAIRLLEELCDAGRTVLLETSGAVDISRVDPRVHRIMDLKPPGSGESLKNRWENIAELTRKDEVKFVLTDRTDYEWMQAVITRYDLCERAGCVLASCVFGRLDPRQLVEWVLQDGLRVRVQLQLHKYIWGACATGV